MSYYKKKADIEQEDKSKELLEKIETGLKDFLNSDKYKEFLNFQSKFHSYSLNNTIAIVLQNPEASYVAGYKAWQRLGRQVNKGEKGIKILAPSLFKYEKEIDKKDEITNKPILNEKGEVIKETKIVEGLAFKVISVFDVSQTTGKDLPEICGELKGNSINSEKLIQAIKNISKVPIFEENIKDGSKGYYNRASNKIVYKENMSFDQTAKTLVHEYAHSILHNTDEKATLPRETKEVQAESVAYIVSEHFGLDTSDYSFGYIASWSSNKEFPELKDTFNLINKTASNIIEEIKIYFENELDVSENILKINLNSDTIIEFYKDEFPAIKYVSDKTMDYLKNLCLNNDKIISIKEVKENYKNLCQLINNPENINNKELYKELKETTDTINDFKQATISFQNENILILNKNINIEMSI